MKSDSELLDAWRAGDLEAGEELFERYYDKIYRFFRNKVPDSMEDLVQQTFAACTEGKDRVRSHFRSYLFGIACNILRGHLRLKQPSNELIDYQEHSIADIAPGPSTLFGRRREHRILLQALRSIPVEHQILLELRYWEQLKVPEIAEILEIPSGTASSRLRRAHDLLKQAANKLAENPDELRSTLADLDGWAKECRDQME